MNKTIISEICFIVVKFLLEKLSRRVDNKISKFEVDSIETVYRK